MIARRIGTITGKLVANLDYIEQQGAPRTLAERAGPQALMQETDSWRLMDGGDVVSFQPRGTFKADSGTALTDMLIEHFKANPGLWGRDA